MSRLMDSNGTAFCLSGNFRFLFQTTYDTVYGIEEILLTYEFLAMTGSDKCCFVADIGDISTGEARSLACQQVYVYRIIYFDRTQVYTEYFFTFVEVGEVYMYLTVKTSSTQQSLVQYVYTVGSSQDDYTTVGTETVHFS